jgi:hypothetical protein
MGTPGLPGANSRGSVRPWARRVTRAARRARPNVDAGARSPHGTGLDRSAPGARPAPGRTPPPDAGARRAPVRLRIAGASPVGRARSSRRPRRSSGFPSRSGSWVSARCQIRRWHRGRGGRQRRGASHLVHVTPTCMARGSGDHMDRDRRGQAISPVCGNPIPDRLDSHRFGCQRATSPTSGAATMLRHPAGPSRGSSGTEAPSRRARSVTSATSSTST